MNKKKNKRLFIKLGCVFSLLALVFTFSFISVKADTSNDYNTGYNDGYTQGVEDAFSNFNTYDVLSNFYQNGIPFISTNSGVSYSNASQLVTISHTGNSSNVIVSATNGFSTLDTTSYYVALTFTSPCNIKAIRTPASNSPIFEKVVVNGEEFSFTYTNIDNVGYMWSNQILKKTSSVDIYFKGRSNMANNFSIYIDGYDTTTESYERGFTAGKIASDKQYQDQIDSLENNIDVLTAEISSLNNILNNNNSWQSMFFAMADTPFKTVQNMLGFDVLGVNLFGAFVGFITVLAILWVFKKLIK